MALRALGRRVMKDDKVSSRVKLMTNKDNSKYSSNNSKFRWLNNSNKLNKPRPRWHRPSSRWLLSSRWRPSKQPWSRHSKPCSNQV